MGAPSRERLMQWLSVTVGILHLAFPSPTPPGSVVTSAASDPSTIPSSRPADLSTHSAKESTTQMPFKEKCYPLIGCFNNSAPFDNDPLLPYDPDKLGTEFRLYGRRIEGFKLLSIHDDDVSNTVQHSQFNASLRTRVIIHGFRNSINQTWMHNMKDAFLNIEDSNVILVGWGSGAKILNYDQSAANTRMVARQLLLLLQRLMRETGLKLKDVHLIGHSLGAHIGGNTGRQLRGQIGRITGLDPAAPDFQNWSNVVLLDRTDALFVDNVHTNGLPLGKGGFGMSIPTGDVDFFVNGGLHQPGCKGIISSLWNSGAYGLSCSHRRSHELFLESISSECEFTAYPCENQTMFEQGHCLNCEPGGCSQLGLYADLHPARGSFYINTKTESPFCGFHYSVTIHAGHGPSTTGTIFMTLHGVWGETDVIRVTEEDEKISSEVDYVAMAVVPKAVGPLNAITVRYNKYAGMWGWSILGGGNDNFAVDAVDVVVGDGGNSYRFCVPTLQLTYSQDLTIPVSTTRDC